MAASPKSDRHDARGWRARAAVCRAMATMLGTGSGEKALQIALQYEQRADEIERAQACDESGSR